MSGAGWLPNSGEPIGYDRGGFPIRVSPQWYRAYTAAFERLGGIVGKNVADIDALSTALKTMSLENAEAQEAMRAQGTENADALAIIAAKVDENATTLASLLAVVQAAALSGASSVPPANTDPAPPINIDPIPPINPGVNLP